ncbi:MAG TPA: CBS domain-containing protein [Candidatus Kryptonia bacterium]|nr:CBS domain-containing protein [Candidatus Kryptonia bacterium]
MMTVRDLMETEVATLKSNDSLSLADDIMRLGRIRHLPVVSGERLVGILTQRDLFRAAISSVLRLRPTAERDWLLKIHVSEVMTPNVVTAVPAASVRSAVGLMIERQIGCLPVVENGRLVGLLTETACLRYLARLLDLSDAKRDLPDAAGSD